MGVYLKLCTDLQRSLAAKDGLYQYRNICKDTNLNSFKCVIEAFLDLAEQKASSAREESAQTVLDIEDLDAIQTPERYCACMDIYALCIRNVGWTNFLW